ncbi:MAG: hypothetical protein AAFP81_01095 [Pseudomonadota bacterium]
MSSDVDEIHPELAQTSGVFRELMNAGDELMTIGIDPATAVVIAAAVPIALRILRIANEASSAVIQNWLDEQKLVRKRKEYELDEEFDRS